MALSQSFKGTSARPLVQTRHRVGRPVSVAVRASGEKPGCGRREALSGMLRVSGMAAIWLAGASASQARDYKAALAAKEARKSKLRDTAGNMKKSGEDQQVFKQADYSVSEEARTPNVHSRQNEGARTQENA